MSSSSVSFRISRHTQDLAETVHALSQRLVTLEQRLEGLEAHLQALRQQPRQAEAEEAASLAPIEANIERLLQDCRQLLAEQPAGFGEPGSSPEMVDGEADRSLQAVGDGLDACEPDADAAEAALLHEDPLEDAQAA